PRPRRGGGRGARGSAARQGARRPRHRDRRDAGEARDRAPVGRRRPYRLQRGGLGRARQGRPRRRRRRWGRRPPPGRRPRRRDEVPRLRGPAPHDRLRGRPHPHRRRQPPPPQEHQRGRRPLGLLSAARLAARPGVDGRSPQALRRGPDPPRDLPRLSAPRGGRRARGAVVSRVLWKGGPGPMTQHIRAPRFLSARELADFRRDGFLVCRGLFGPGEVTELRRATEEVQAWPEQPGGWMVYGEKSLREAGRRLINRVENFYPYHPGFKALFDGDKLLGRVNDLL